MTHAGDEGLANDGAQRRAEALREAARGRTVRAEQAVEKGIRTLVKDGGRISFAAVARPPACPRNSSTSTLTIRRASVSFGPSKVA